MRYKNGENILTKIGKAYLIESIFLLASCVLTIILFAYFESQGQKKIAVYCLLFSFTPIGIYTIFGKYVCLKSGVFPAPLSERLMVGLFFILIPPIMYFIRFILR